MIQPDVTGDHISPDGYYGSFEAPNGCAMDATFDRGALRITAHPPEWARPEFVTESEDWAHDYSSFGIASVAAANAYLRSLGVREHVFGDIYDLANGIAL